MSKITNPGPPTSPSSAPTPLPPAHVATGQGPSAEGLGPRPSRVHIRHHGILLALLHQPPTAPKPAPAPTSPGDGDGVSDGVGVGVGPRVCDSVLSPPWAPLVIALPLPLPLPLLASKGQPPSSPTGDDTSSSSSSLSPSPVFADPFDLYDAVAAGLTHDGDVLQLTLALAPAQAPAQAEATAQTTAQALAQAQAQAGGDDGEDDGDCDGRGQVSHVPCLAYLTTYVTFLAPV